MLPLQPDEQANTSQAVLQGVTWTRALPHFMLFIVQEALLTILIYPRSQKQWNSIAGWWCPDSTELSSLFAPQRASAVLRDGETRHFSDFSEYRPCRCREMLVVRRSTNRVCGSALYRGR